MIITEFVAAGKYYQFLAFEVKELEISTKQTP
jgi:hypothetical protein